MGGIITRKKGTKNIALRKKETLARGKALAAAKAPKLL